MEERSMWLQQLRGWWNHQCMLFCEGTYGFEIFTVDIAMYSSEAGSGTVGKCLDGSINGSWNTSGSVIMIIFHWIVVSVIPRPVAPNYDPNLVERREVLYAQTRRTIQALHLMHTKLKLHVLKLWHWSCFKLQWGPTKLDTQGELFQTSESLVAREDDPSASAPQVSRLRKSKLGISPRISTSSGRTHMTSSSSTPRFPSEAIQFGTL